MKTLFAFMRYERDWWRLQINHEALARSCKIPAKTDDCKLYS